MPDQVHSNLLADVPTRMVNEVFETLATGSNVRIERIVSHGHTSPETGWYDQDQAEWVAVLEGSAELTFEDNKTLPLKRGDHVLIPSHKKHKVSWTDPDRSTVWLAVFFDEADANH